MQLLQFFGFVLALVASSMGVILQNGQVRTTSYPNTSIDLSQYSFTTYFANAAEISYKGRWDSLYNSWWSAAGLKFGFTGNVVAITFGPSTVNSALVAYRIDGEDRLFTNVTTNGTHLLVGLPALNVNITWGDKSSFELRVANWGAGIQIENIHVALGASLFKIPDHRRTIEVIGDSLSAGQYSTLEALSSYAYSFGAGLGNTEYTVTAYPGICLVDQYCNGNLHGQSYQWFYTSDTSYRSTQIWGEQPVLWEFGAHPAADIVVINLGANDANAKNNVSSQAYVQQYTHLVEGIHGVWPKAQIILVELWCMFSASENSYKQLQCLRPEIYSVYQYFNSVSYLTNPIIYNHTTGREDHIGHPEQPFVHYFNTTGILQHNDLSPKIHPTDIGHIKIATALMQFVRLKFGWDLESTGPEVQSGTTYWNDECCY